MSGFVTCKWIKVSTRLPMFMVCVITTDGKTVKPTYMTSSDKMKNQSWGAWAPTDKVTHWMPLPEPPK